MGDRWIWIKANIKGKKAGMSRHSVAGWVMTLVGCVLWGIGWFVDDHWQFIKWAEFTPWWISECLPNWQSEVGALLVILGSVPIYYDQYQALKQINPRD